MTAFDQKAHLLALHVVANEQGLPIPTDLNIAIINAGLGEEHLRQAQIMSGHVTFIRAALVMSDEELEDLEVPDRTLTMITAIRELLTPEHLDAIKEEEEHTE